jgi:hypothetical protein
MLMSIALKKYLLTLFGLFLSSYFYTLSGSAHDTSASVKGLESSGFCCFQNEVGRWPKISNEDVSRIRDFVKIYTEKNEEESVKPAVPGICINNYFTSFYIRPAKATFQNVKTQLPVFAHWFYSSSQRFSILRVWRL